jgi:hypothetical protein
MCLLGEKFLQLDEDSSGNCTVEDGMTNLHKCGENSYRLLCEFDHKRDPCSHNSPPQSLHNAYWRILIGGRTETTPRISAKLGKEFDTWRRFMAEAVLRFFSIPGQPEFANLIATCALGRKFYITSQGYIGLVLPFAEVGDAVLIRRAQIPFVLRTVVAVVEQGLSCPVSSRGGGVCSWIDVWGRSGTRRRA